MLTNSVCIDANKSVYIASTNDVCNFCLDEFAKEHGVPYVMAREQLSGKLNGERIFKIQFHGRTYVICAHHLEELLNLVAPKCEEETKSTDEEPEKPKPATRGRRNTK